MYNVLCFPSVSKVSYYLIMSEHQLTIKSSKQRDLLLSCRHGERAHSLMLDCFRDSIHGGSISQSFYE